MDNKKKIKLLVVLIIIGIIAVLVSIYILKVKPLAAELSKQDRDPIRIEDLTLIDSALSKLRDSNQDAFLGDQNRVYISIPAYSTNCSGLNLPPLPNNWEYRCQTEKNYRDLNGQGWLPVDFTKLPEDFKFKSSLPTDSVNTAESGYYYSYVVGENNNFVLTSLLESDENLKKITPKDGGTDSVRLEVGSNLQLWAKAQGLVGYWKFDEGQGIEAADSSGNNTGTLMNEPAWVDGRIGKALSFNGKDNYVKTSNPLNIENGEITFETWAYLLSNATPTHPTLIGRGGQPDNGAVSFGFVNTSNLRLDWSDGTTGNYAMFDARQYRDNWHHFVAVLSYPNNYARIYVDGILKSEQTMGSFAFKLNWPILIGNSWGVHSWNGFIDEVKIYNRALNSSEIRTVFNATK
ncbi:MAG: LamG domain-containing protein [Candidatus Nealsonbacteria bacterium]|nr:LamG domain-containing protein [Candidatus Nealsonbacteria bacterium]